VKRYLAMNRYIGKIVQPTIITDAFVSKFKELKMKVGYIKYSALVITKIFFKSYNSRYTTLNTRQS
jgi:hypothetical protein